MGELESQEEMECGNILAPHLFSSPRAGTKDFATALDDGKKSVFLTILMYNSAEDFFTGRHLWL